MKHTHAKRIDKLVKQSFSNNNIVRTSNSQFNIHVKTTPKNLAIQELLMNKQTQITKIETFTSQHQSADSDSSSKTSTSASGIP